LTPIAAGRAAASIPYFQRGVLPETSGDPPDELPVGLATWLVGWYALSAFDTGKIG